MPHLWSGRFDEEPDASVFSYGVSLAFDRQLFEDDVTGSLAWAEALARAGVLSEADAAAIAGGLREILDAGRRDPDFVSGPDEDIHAFVERQLVERIGEAGKRLHTGRSRNEQVSLDLRLYLRRRTPSVVDRLTRLIAALASRAGACGDATMPSYTHLRRAQPILAAHFFLAHAAAFRRDVGRFEQAIREADEMPLGSGAIAGTTYAVDTALLAERLGFSRTVINSLDASSDRDFVAGFLYACSLAMVHLSRLAEDLIIFTSEEFGFFELPDRFATGSSLMPQKKNPDPLELARGKSGRVLGRLAGWLATMKGLPGGYNRDLQEDKEAVFEAEATLASSLDACAAVVAGLELNAPRAEAAASGVLLATDVADYLVAKGVAFRDAHAIVGAIVRKLVAEGRDFASLSLEEWRTFNDRIGPDVTGAISPRASVAAKRTPQSTNPDAVRAALGELAGWLEARRR
jgi:argininosuccinate lyase